jgi:hypothetical protein
LNDHPEQCRALAGRIAMEMDMQLECLERLEGVAFPDRTGRDYLPCFDRTVRKIYAKTVGRPFPASVEI